MITLEPPGNRLGDLTSLVNEVERGTLEPHEIRLVEVVHGWVSTLESEEWTDLDVAGFFFTLSSRLLVLKLRLLLPTLLDEEPLITIARDPSLLGGLGEQLALLEERQRDLAFCTLEPDGPIRRRVLGDVDSLTALLKAAGEIIRTLQKTGFHSVTGEFMAAEEARARVSALLARGPQSLEQILGAAVGLYEALSYFLALLEVIRLGWCTIRVDGDMVWLEPLAALGGDPS
ncbi:MAG: hypothetical protein MUE60_02745 [Candidatus Eisenbacteria bacterium]|nr:hypothetical protein [Candidatus Eisenbacteria bacterium]